MKRAIFLLGVLGFALIVIGLPFDKSEAAPSIVIKAVNAWPVDHINTRYYKEFINRVNEKAKGELEIQFLGGPEIVSVFDQLKAAGTGVVDMIHSVPAYYAGVVPEGNITDLAKHGFELNALRESGIIDLYTQAFLEKGKVMFLGYAQSGMAFRIVTKKPVSKLEDIRGLKLRSIGGLSDVFFGELGASVVKISSAETYEGLQKGVVDGVLRNTMSLVEFKEYEVLKYILNTAITTPCTGVFVGEGKWNTIPKHLQTMMKKEMIAVEAEANKYFGDLDKFQLKELQEKYGMKVVYLSDQDALKLNQVRAGAAIKDWIYKKAPVFGPPIYEKMVPYIK